MLEYKPVCVVIIDSEGYHLASLHEDVATTLIAVASEDPADWAEMLAYWPRYTTRAVPEFASSLPIESVSRELAIGKIGDTDSWIVLDLTQKRYLSGTGFQPVGRDGCFSMTVDGEDDQQGEFLSIHFAPWWEIFEAVVPAAVEQARQSTLVVPDVDRDFLFGQPLLDGLATHLLSLAVTQRGWKAITSDNPRRLYKLTVEVHRDWLMTPREEIGGKCPRQMLHGGKEWIDKIVHGHRLRFESGAGSIVAAPTNVSGYPTAPMGMDEMVVYFDLCRELINAGWHWCRQNLARPGKRNHAKHPHPKDEASFRALVETLSQTKNDWLASPFEGDSPPGFIIECSRRRVPRGSGIEIVGMDQRQSEQHITDCDCPICQMMADGGFGVGFTFIDGHHLELDNEFAFSTHETREEWETEQQELAEFSTWNHDNVTDQQRFTHPGTSDDDEFTSVWSSGMPAEPLPGDPTGNMKMAFLLAEIVSELQSAPENDETIKKINSEFKSFRIGDPENLVAIAEQFSETLESVLEKNPELTPRVADFQSRIAERLRVPVTGCDNDEVF